MPFALSNSKSPITEAYRTIRTNLQFASVANNIRLILITSSVPSEGKTSTACNLAVVSAQAGKRVLLIDADLRKPQMHRWFQASNIYGLSNLIIKEKNIVDCVITSDVPNLDLLTSGPVPPNPSEMLASKSFFELMEGIRNSYDLVILDAPPVLSVADALILTPFSDGIVFIVDSASTSRILAKKAVQALQQVGGNILGVVLNKIKRNSKESYYYYNYYGSVSNSKVDV